MTKEIRMFKWLSASFSLEGTGVDRLLPKTMLKWLPPSPP